MTGAGGLIVGVDVGGTFTDLFVLDEARGDVRIVKVPSTRGEEARGFMTGLAHAAGVQDARSDLAGVVTIVHGTTVATNALLERKLPRTGLITTEGFGDVLEMRRRDRPRTWGLRGEFVPLVPRDLRLEVAERTLADGTVHTPVDLAQVELQTRRLLSLGCEAICVFFINGYANQANERAAAELIRRIWPNAHVSIATEVLCEIREFERCSTTAINASLQPVVGDYLERLAEGLREQRFTGELLIVQSSGGVMSSATAAQLPARTALSGPAAGVIACAAIAQASGFPNVITGDMGGTSFDVSLIANGSASIAEQSSIDFGLVIRSPMIQIETIGAGGGSIASVDASGMLQVGPASAGSNPGPACYGKGNLFPTVTDANLLLGRIDPARPIGGGLLGSLNRDLALQAIRLHVADPLGIEALEAAEAILTVANARMAGAIRLVSIEKGYDPRLFAYMPFGGGGALHVCAMQREVGVVHAIIPRYPGVTSALGCVMADMRHDAVLTVNRGVDQVDYAALAASIDTFARACQDRLDSANVAFSEIREHVWLDMLYAGQTHTLRVEVAPAGLDARSVRAQFGAAYRAAYGRLLEGIPVRVMNLRYARIGVRPKFDLRILAPRADAGAAGSQLAEPKPLGSQRVYHAGRWWAADRYDRLALPVGFVIDGPAICEQSDTTVWIEPGFSARVDDLGNLIVRVRD